MADRDVFDPNLLGNGGWRGGEPCGVGVNVNVRAGAAEYVFLFACEVHASPARVAQLVTVGTANTAAPNTAERADARRGVRFVGGPALTLAVAVQHADPGNDPLLRLGIRCREWLVVGNVDAEGMAPRHMYDLSAMCAPLSIIRRRSYGSKIQRRQL